MYISSSSLQLSTFFYGSTEHRVRTESSSQTTEKQQHQKTRSVSFSNELKEMRPIRRVEKNRKFFFASSFLRFGSASSSSRISGRLSSLHNGWLKLLLLAPMMAEKQYCLMASRRKIYFPDSIKSDLHPHNSTASTHTLGGWRKRIRVIRAKNSWVECQEIGLVVPSMPSPVTIVKVFLALKWEKNCSMCFHAHFCSHARRPIPTTISDARVESENFPTFPTALSLVRSYALSRTPPPPHALENFP